MLVEQYRDLNKERSTDKIDKYFDTKTLKRLQGKGLFCGMDFVGIDSLRPIEYYSRFEHSRNVLYSSKVIPSSFINSKNSSSVLLL